MNHWKNISMQRTYMRIDDTDQRVSSCENPGYYAVQPSSVWLSIIASANGWNDTNKKWTDPSDL